MNVHTIGNTTRKITLQVFDESAGKLDVFESAGQFTASVRQSLALLTCDECGELVGTLREQFAKLKENRRPLTERRCCPDSCTCRGTREYIAACLVTGDWDRANLLSRCGVVERHGGLYMQLLTEFAVYVVLNGCHWSRSNSQSNEKAGIR